MKSRPVRALFEKVPDFVAVFVPVDCHHAAYIQRKIYPAACDRLYRQVIVLRNKKGMQYEKITRHEMLRTTPWNFIRAEGLIPRHLGHMKGI
jgi:hypothetical protein